MIQTPQKYILIPGCKVTKENATVGEYPPSQATVFQSKSTTAGSVVLYIRVNLALDTDLA